MGNKMTEFEEKIIEQNEKILKELKEIKEAFNLSQEKQTSKLNVMVELMQDANHQHIVA